MNKKTHIAFSIHDITNNYSKYVATAMILVFLNTKQSVEIHLLHDETLSKDIVRIKINTIYTMLICINMGDKMKVTIITVCYNAEDTIEQTMESVFMQTYPDIEYIIIDGKSTDKTVDIIKKYEHKINYWISEEDRGLYHAMNKGIEKATGDYIQFLHADDALVDKNSIKKIIPFMEKYPCILSTPVWCVDEINFLQIKEENCFHFHTMVSHQGMFTRIDYLKKFLFNEKYHIAADYNFLLQCVNDGAYMSFLNFPIVFFGLGGISSNDNYFNEMFDEHIRVMEENKLSKKLIEERKKSMSRSKIRKFIKKILSKMGLLEYLRRKKLLKSGWTLHHCNNKHCRWCEKIKNRSSVNFRQK